MNGSRQQRIEQALFRGATLTMENPSYRHAVGTLVEVLLRGDLAPRDLTVESLGIRDQCASGCILTRDDGVTAGLAEAVFLLEAHGVDVRLEKNDGDVMQPGDVLLRATGQEGKLLVLERVALNLVQRMSGIATSIRGLQDRAWRYHSATRIVGTRKTPWGLLDKRALHLGNGGTHRLGLGDAMIIKNNHLALLSAREEEAVFLAIQKAWRFRNDSAFIEIEVRTGDAARAAAQVFRRLQEEAAEEYPCLLMLDNMTPDRISTTLDMLRCEGLWDHTLVEASGGISESNLEEYVTCGVDAISVGALTHSSHALDICQRIS
jgi:nicotinate-nucleotide pyrophosphorylase (carboxylating)